MIWVALVGLGWLAVLLLPFQSLVANTHWSALHLAPGDLGAVATSLLYTLSALGIVLVLGTPLAFWLARYRFRGHALVDALLLVPLLTPSLAMGILLISTYGPNASLGRLAEQLGLSLTNTPAAFVLAQVYASAPYYVLGARAAFKVVPPGLEEAARTLGDSPWRIFWRVTLPLAGVELGVATAIAWVRALGEFGIVLIVAYHPQGIPVKLWVNLQDIGLPSVYPLLWLFFLIGLPLPLFLDVLAKRRHRKERFEATVTDVFGR